MDDILAIHILSRLDKWIRIPKIDDTDECERVWISYVVNNQTINETVPFLFSNSVSLTNQQIKARACNRIAEDLNKKYNLYVSINNGE